LKFKKMENLFESFRAKIPNFNADYKTDVFEKLSLYGGGGKKKENFRVPIKDWGNKTGRLLRKDFSQIQEYIFTALIAKADIDFIAIEKGQIDEDSVIKNLLYQFESFTNGGLIFLKSKYEEHPAYFMRATYLLDLIKESSK